MRCPKCGYITFDHLEICPKCKKNIAKISEELSGNIFKVEVPLFLKFEIDEPEMEPDVSVDIPVEEEDAELEVTVDGDDIPDIEFSFEEEDFLDDSSPADDDRKEETVDAGIQAEGLEETSVSPDTPEGEEDLVLSEEEDFAGFDLDEEEQDEGHEESTDDEKDEIGFSGEEDFSGFDLDEGEKESADSEDGPHVDFSALDIADLAPPEAEENEAETEEFTPGDESRAAAAGSAPSPSEGMSGAGLEDLQIDGFDLDLPSPDAAPGKKKRSTVKTGTALDDFDFDLGELISDKEK